jgi:hypothetical protein
MQIKIEKLPDGTNNLLIVDDEGSGQYRIPLQSDPSTGPSDNELPGAAFDPMTADWTDVPLSGADLTGAYGAPELDGPLIKTHTSQVLSFAAFTDDGGASGHRDFSQPIPVAPPTYPTRYGIILGWRAIVTVGFTGDVAAQVQLGVEGNLGRFSPGSPKSVFAAGTYIVAGDDFDEPEIESTVTPRVTITTDSDFSLVSAGSMSILIYYLEMHSND